jgi:hypothetical protein
MPHSWKGIIAGFIATIVISIIFVALSAAGIEEFNIVSMIDVLGSIQRTAAWVDHFIVGTFLWGPIFAGFETTLSETRPRWQKGLLFGLISWVLMMLIFMPVIGYGPFGYHKGFLEPVGMLVLNLIYGLVLGVVFELLDRKFPTKALVSSEPPLPEMAQFNKPNE